jgi:hypothetical protein
LSKRKHKDRGPKPQKDQQLAVMLPVVPEVDEFVDQQWMENAIAGCLIFVALLAILLVSLSG